MCGWVEGKVAVCKPLGSAVWLAPKGVQRRWCPWLAWWAGDKDNHLERAGGVEKLMRLERKALASSPVSCL